MPKPPKKPTKAPIFNLTPEQLVKVAHSLYGSYTNEPGNHSYMPHAVSTTPDSYTPILTDITEGDRIALNAYMSQMPVKEKLKATFLPGYSKGGKVPQYGLGGNILKGVADMGLGAIGMGNIIPDSAYQGQGAQFANMAAGIGSQLLPNLIPGGGLIQAAGKALFPYGGQAGPNAELEMQENTLNPDGSTTQLDAPSHAQGGAKVQLDPGTLVFSDRLKIGKKTIADLNKPYNTKKEDKILSDPKSNSTAKMTADIMKQAKNKQSLALFQAQEQLKAEKVSKYAQKVGLNSNHMAYGGQLPKYDGLPGHNSIVVDPNDPYNQALSKAGQSTYWQGNPNNGPGMIGSSLLDNNMTAQNARPVMAAVQANYDRNSRFNKSMEQMDNPLDLSQNLLTKNAGAPVEVNTNSTSNYTTDHLNPNTMYKNRQDQSPWQPDMQEIGKQAAIGLGNNIGNIYNLIRSSKNEKETYGRVNPTLLDPTQAIRDNNQVYTQSNAAARETSVGNSATYLNANRANAAQKMSANARIRAEFENQNAGIKNQAAYYNNDIGRQETIANAQNQAQNRNGRSIALNSIGQNVMGQVASNNMSKRDKDYVTLITKQHPELLNDPELKKWFEEKSK